jgi:hypothetical protein
MITTTIEPYCYDIAHVLALPTYFPHRFRYRAKWINLPYKTEDIKDRDGLVVLRNFETGDFIPVRYIQIEDVLSVGDINYIEFRVMNYFSVAKIQLVSKGISETLRERGFENKGGHSLGNLVLEIDEKVIGESGEEITVEEHEKWSEILRVIGGLKCYKDFGFLRILHIRDTKRFSATAIQDETKKYTFSLKPSHLYFLDLIQQIPWEIEKTESIKVPYDVELKSETDEVVILRKIQRVVGKYDLLRFIFKTPSGYTTKHSFLEVENKQGGEVAKYGLPALFLPIRIEPPGWMKVVLRVRLGLSVLAVITLLLSEPIARVIVVEADWIRALALLLLVFASGKWDEFVLAVIKETEGIKIK